MRSAWHVTFGCADHVETRLAVVAGISNGAVHRLHALVSRESSEPVGDSGHDSH